MRRLVSLLCLCAAAQAGEIEFWVADPLVHVLDDAGPGPRRPKATTIHSARGEFENGQIALRANRLVRDVKLSIRPLRGPATQYLTFDVTDHFSKRGEKVLAVILADGWYALGREPWIHKPLFQPLLSPICWVYLFDLHRRLLVAIV